MNKLWLAALPLLGAVAGCSSDNACTVAAGTTYLVMRTSTPQPTDSCTADVIAAVEAVNQTLALGMTEPCGETDNILLATPFTFTPDTDEVNCTGNSSLLIDDLESNGGTGVEGMMVTCDNGLICTATFNTMLTFTD